MIALRILVLTVGVAVGVFLPFSPVILAGLGFAPGAIGLLLSLAAVALTVAIPAWGHTADVWLGRPRTLQLCGVGVALVLVLLFGWPWPPIVIALLFVVVYIFQSGWQPLSDAMTVNTLGRRGQGYGRTRSLMSLTFALGTIAAGAVYERAGFASAFLIGAAAALAMVVASFGIPDVARADLDAHRRAIGRPGAGSGAKVPAQRRTWGLGSSGVAMRVAPRLWAILAAVALVHVAIISGNTFLGLRLIALGGGPSDVALSFGLSALAEIPAMNVAGWVASRIGLRGLFVACGIIYAICLSSWAVLDVPALIIATRLLTGVGFAGVTVGIVLTMATVLPTDLQATGQGLFQMTAFGITAVFANVVGGVLYGSVGASAVFGLGAICAVAAAVVGWFAFPRRTPAGAMR